MTATFDAMTDTKRDPAKPSPARRIDWTRFVVRASGAVLVLAGLGVWLEPSAQSGSDVLAMKMGVSMFLSIAGFIIMQERHDHKLPFVEIDTVRREVRVVKQRKRAKAIIGRTPIRDLGKAEAVGDKIRLSAANGELLAEVALTDPKVRSSLYNALQDAGKL